MGETALAARYDLRRSVASHDFYSWLVVVAARGATEIVFGVDRPKTSKWSVEKTLGRFETIVEPGPALLDLPSRRGTDGTDMWSPLMSDLVEWCEEGRGFPRLRTVLPVGAARYTVTLRRVTSGKQRRNSDESVWRPFAEEIGATVVEDYDVSPVHLHERMALYAGAKMNYFVIGGPAHVCSLSNYPCCVFGVDKHFPRDRQWPWLQSDKRQTMTWEHPTPESLRRWHERMTS